MIAGCDSWPLLLCISISRRRIASWRAGQRAGAFRIADASTSGNLREYRSVLIRRQEKVGDSRGDTSGYACSAMWSATAEIETTVDPALVWALWEDPERWKDWNEQIAEAALHGPFVVGAQARIRFKRSPRSLTFIVTALEPGRLFTDEARLPGTRLGHEHRVAVDGETTKISHRLYFDGPAERIYVLLMGRQMQSAVRRFAARERSLVEANPNLVDIT
jgi:hypothetical protein